MGKKVPNALHQKVSNDCLPKGSIKKKGDVNKRGGDMPLSWAKKVTKKHTAGKNQQKAKGKSVKINGNTRKIDENR